MYTATCIVQRSIVTSTACTGTCIHDIVVTCFVQFVNSLQKFYYDIHGIELVLRTRYYLIIYIYRPHLVVHSFSLAAYILVWVSAACANTQNISRPRGILASYQCIVRFWSSAKSHQKSWWETYINSVR